MVVRRDGRREPKSNSDKERGREGVTRIEEDGWRGKSIRETERKRRGEWQGERKKGWQRRE